MPSTKEIRRRIKSVKSTRQITRAMTRNRIHILDARVLVLGLTFKENVPDARNSKSMQVINLLRRSGCIVTTHDPYHQNHALEGHFDAIVLLVPHREYCTLSPSDFRNIAKETCLFYDLKSVFGKKALETAGFRYLSL